MKGKLSNFTLVVLVLSSLVASVALVGGAAAQETATATAANEPIAEDTLGVDNDTQAVQALAENATGTLDVTVYGVDADGNETEVATGTLDATGNSTDTYEYSSLDPSTYGEYRVVVDGDADAETIEIAKVQVVSGGGGLIGDLGGTNVVAGLGALAGLVALGGAAYVTGRV